MEKIRLASWVLTFLSVAIVGCKTKLKELRGPEFEGSSAPSIQDIHVEESIGLVNNTIRRLKVADYVNNIDRIHASKIKMDSEPTVVFVVVDTLRKDFFTKKDAPFLFQLAARNLSLERFHSASTSTAHSFFSLLFGYLSHQRYVLINKPWIEKENPAWADSYGHFLGSPWLNVFKQAGYSLNLYSWPDTGFCPHKAPFKLLDTPQILHLQLLYSLDPSAFLDECPSYKKVQPQSDNFGQLDHDLFNRVIGKMKKMRMTKSFHFIHSQGVHMPYGWIKKSTTLEKYRKKYPFVWRTPSALNWGWGYQKPEGHESIVNSYANSIRSLDFQMWRLAEHLKKSGQWDNTLLVVVSDHGHSLIDLPDPAHIVGHGLDPYKDQTHVPAIIKWPKDLELPGIIDEESLTSNLDIFPTIFAALGVKAKAYVDDAAALGKNLFKEKRNCVVSFRPTYDMPRMVRGKYFPPKMMTRFAFIGEEERVFLKFKNSKNIFNSDKIAPFRINDKNGDPIKHSMSAVKFRKFLEDKYSECLEQIFASAPEDMLEYKYGKAIYSGLKESDLKSEP